jgi:hypothetical protein
MKHKINKDKTRFENHSVGSNLEVFIINLAYFYWLIVLVFGLFLLWSRPTERRLRDCFETWIFGLELFQELLSCLTHCVKRQHTKESLNGLTYNQMGLALMLPL